MIERASEFGASSAAPLVAADRAHMSAGDMLREAREAHGLHIEMVAAALKVPPQKIQALEDDDIEALPDPVFARALAASVCRALRIDPAPVLAKLPGALRPGLAEADKSMGSHIREGAPRSGGTASGRPSRTALIVVALLLVAAGALFLMPQTVFDQVGAAFTRMTASSTSGSAGGADEAAPSAAAPPGTVVEPVAPSLPPAESAAASPAAPSAGPAPEPAAPASNDVLSFTARAEVWVTVTEAGGKQLLRRTLLAGETVALSGALPLAVVVGRASSVDVQVRGQPFDLAPVTRGGGVARFEVKP
ncbi:MAG: helix-turn-helix domain-containing protein [Variovorax sp.]|nr:MAG: helix-turn-helix domain-containing protein [Variovorax sp.]